MPKSNGQLVKNDHGLPDYMTINRVLQFAQNAYSMRDGLARGQNANTDTRRSIEDECGYPALDAVLDPHYYQQLYERCAIAARVVEVLPRSCWQAQPSVYETEEQEVTPFEESWDNLSKQLSPGGFYQDEQGGLLWDYLRRVDEQAGIGSFGLLLLGFNDGQPLGTPMVGVGIIDEDDEDEEEEHDLSPEDQEQTAFPGDPKSDPLFSNNPLGRAKAKAKQFGSKAKSPFSRNKRFIPELPVLTANFKDPGTNEPPTPGQLRGKADDRGTQYGHEGPTGQPPPRKEGTKLKFLRVFPEHLVQVVQWESNLESPRFGQPIRYLITLNDPRQQTTGVGVGSTSHYVHWSRVIHVPSDLTSSEVNGTPRMRPVLDHILATRKIYAASGEGYWKMAFTIKSFETHPQLGGDVDVDTDALKDMLEELDNGLQRALFTSGMTVNGLAPTVLDPTPFIEAHLQAICVKIPCPKRVFMGSERGELASAQDDSQWNDQLRARNLYVTTPRIVVPFVDRLIQAGVLPEPKARQIEDSAQRFAKLKGGAEAEAVPGEEAPNGKPGFGGKPGGGKPGGFGGGKPPFAGNVRTYRRKRTRMVWVSNASLPPKFLQDQQRKQAQVGGKTLLDAKDQPLPTKPGMTQVPIEEESTVIETPGGYSIEWPDLDSLGKMDKAAIALSNTQAVAAYVAGQVEALIPPHQFLTSSMFMDMDAEEASAMLEEAEAAAEVKMEEDALKAEALGLDPMAPEGFQKPFDDTADDVKLKPGEALANPETGQVLKGNPAPGEVPSGLQPFPPKKGKKPFAGNVENDIDFAANLLGLTAEEREELEGYNVD